MVSEWKVNANITCSGKRVLNDVDEHEKEEGQSRQRSFDEMPTKRSADQHSAGKWMIMMMADVEWQNERMKSEGGERKGRRDGTRRGKWRKNRSSQG